MANFKARTFNICMAYLRNRNCKTKRALLRCLRCWAKGELKPYGYVINHTEEFELDVRYASDRMNSGRAKALLNHWGFA